MTIFTCTPVSFGGGPDFFARDSGLLCKGFQALGHTCKAVMPLPSHDADQHEDLIRTDPADLEDVRWWRKQKPELVVLYAWGSPRYARVAKAIRSSGAFLILNQDSGGLVSPIVGLKPWFQEQWILSGGGTTRNAWRKAMLRTIRGLSVGLGFTDPMRAEHLSNGHVIACVSPKAAEHYRVLCRRYRGNELADRVAVIPHPVEPGFRFDGEGKERKIACIGRWRDSIQKRPRLLIDVIGSLLESDPLVTVEIAGVCHDEIETWHRSLDEGRGRRVSLHGRIGREELAALLRRCRVFYSPSAYESFGIAAAEALCSGCSVVAQQSVSMTSFDWFVSENSGRLATSDAANSHVAALAAELDTWDRGKRDPLVISSIWSQRLHADKVADRILRLMNGDRLEFSAIRAGN